MKSWLFAFLFLLGLVCNSQDLLPNFDLPSPTAFEFTKYGGVSINEYSGRVTPNIPLYVYNAGNLQVPISLVYQGNGVKVDQLSSWTGINWILQAGGVITRIVRDRPDELGNRIFHSKDDLLDLATSPQGEADIDALESVASLDTQADLFSYSFLGTSGSFYLDEQMEPKTINYSQELRIEFIGGFQDTDYQEIVLTDASGIKYYFGGIDGTERTRSFTGSSIVRPTMPITSFYLTKISHPKGDEIHFQYGSEPQAYEVTISKQESYSALSLNGVSSTYDGQYSWSTVSNQMHNGKYLLGISSNRSDLELDFTSTSYTNENYNRVLNSMILARGVDVLRRFDFSYISSNGLSNSDRFFMDKIIFKGSDQNKVKEYSFDYVSPFELPDRLSNSKDYLGYFNGKYNSNALPQTSNPYMQLPLTGISSLANRDPDFEESVKGALSKITYPTGGYTMFEYEAPKIQMVHHKNVSMEVYCNLSEMNPEAYPVPDTELMDDHAFLAPLEGIVFDEDQIVKMTMDVEAQGSIDHHYKIHVQVEDITDLQSSPVVVFQDNLTLSYDTYEYTKDFSFEFEKNRQYTVKLELELPVGVSNPAPVRAQASLEYIDKKVEGNDLGLRVKRITDYPVHGSPISKRYYYQKPEDLGDVTKLPLKDYDDYGDGFILQHDFYYWDNMIQNDKLVTKISMMSDPSFNIFPEKYFFNRYVVISHGGDQFENGGVFKEFYMTSPEGLTEDHFFGSTNENYRFSYPDFQKNNDRVFNGSPVREVYFYKADSGGLFINKEIRHEYSHESSEYTTNMIVDRYYELSDMLANVVDGIHVDFYNIYHNRFNKISETQIEYVEPVPLTSEENTESFDRILSKKEFQYTTYTGLPSKVIQSTSDKNLLIEEQFWYPEDVESTTSLGHEDLLFTEFYAAESMKNIKNDGSKGGHRLTDVLQKETRVRDSLGNLLATTVRRNNFQDWGNGFIMPLSVQTSKDDMDLEYRVHYHGYDTWGNAKEISLANGPHSYYIWGYNGRFPVAKIDDFTSTEASAVSGLIEAVITASNNDVSQNDENLLRTALSNLRNSPELFDKLVTTYTYDPESGLTSTTDAKGHTVFYSYDQYGRLKDLRNEDDEIIEDYTYKYKEVE